MPRTSSRKIHLAKSELLARLRIGEPDARQDLLKLCRAMQEIERRLDARIDDPGIMLRFCLLKKLESGLSIASDGLRPQPAYAPRCSLHKPSFSCAARSEKLKSTASVRA